MYNSGNMFGFTGHDIVKAITENSDTFHGQDDQPKSQPRPNLIQILKNRLQPRLTCDVSTPAKADFASSVQSR